MLGRYQSITECLMVAGHTKLSCVCYFGLIKKRYIQSKIDTMADVSHVVTGSQYPTTYEKL